MNQYQKILLKILLGQNDNNIDFASVRSLLLTLGFKERIKGSHHIFYKSGVEEIINLQSIGKLSKPYQIKQVRNIILKYKLGDNIE